MRNHVRTTILLALLAFTAACASSSRYLGLTSEEVFAIAEQEFAEEDWEGTIEALEVLIASFPSYERMAEVRLMMARAYFNDEKYYTAQQEYTRFLDRYPRHEQIPHAALMMCRSFVELSPIPQRDQTYTEQAARVCQNVVNDYTGIDDEVAAEAQEHLNRMRAKLAEKLFMTADNFYLERDLLDSSIIYFEKIVEEYGDTVWAPRALGRLVEVYQEIGYDEEVESYRQQLVRSYPDTPEGRAAAAALAQEGAAAQPDTATVAGVRSF